ncbi:MAG TPA: hypothetical protein VGL97_08925 [Bryobacteraceae bacterium]
MAAKDTQKPKRGSGRTGPITESGKGTSSQNATVHGMCSKMPVLPEEDAAEREAVFVSWFARYEPVDECERGLVTDVAQGEWFKRRCGRRFAKLEAELNGLAPMAWKEEDHKRFERFLRYKTSAERTFTRALRTLEQQRKIRLQEEREEAEREEAKPTEEAAKAPKAASLDERMSQLQRPPGVFQLVQVRIEEGRTVTWAHPFNATVRRQLELKGPETTVWRRFEFPEGVPPEYAWVAITPEEQGTEKAHYAEKLSAAEWRRARAQDEARGDGHVGPCGT